MARDLWTMAYAIIQLVSQRITRNLYHKTPICVNMSKNTSFYQLFIVG